MIIIFSNLVFSPSPCSKNSTILEEFHAQIRRRELYPKDSALVDELLRFMATQPIVHACEYAHFAFLISRPYLCLIINASNDLFIFFSFLLQPRSPEARSSSSSWTTRTRCSRSSSPWGTFVFALWSYSIFLHHFDYGEEVLLPIGRSSSFFIELLWRDNR